VADGEPENPILLLTLSGGVSMITSARRHHRRNDTCMT